MMRRMMLMALMTTGVIAQFANADIAPMPRPRPQLQPRLGVSIKQYNDGTQQGMLVTGVEQGSPATKLRRNGKVWSLEADIDVILAIDGNPVQNLAAYRAALANGGANPTITVYDRRAGKVVEYQARVPQSRLGGALERPDNTDNPTVVAEAAPFYGDYMLGGCLATALASCGYLIRRKNSSWVKVRSSDLNRIGGDRKFECDVESV